MFCLYIDVRENKLKDYFQLKHKDKSNIIIKQLDLGDIVFKNSSDSTVVIIERKTIADLRASIKDGRHREQKMRLCNNYPKEVIYYLLKEIY